MVWLTADKRRIKVSDMATEHLRNTIAMIEREHKDTPHYLTPERNAIPIYHEMKAELAGRKTMMKAAWERIRDRYGAQLAKIEDIDGWADSWISSPSIFDEIQREYREGRIYEPERDAMREHVKTWLHDDDTYACGLWAPSAGPMGEDEHAIILMTVQLLAEEAA